MSKPHNYVVEHMEPEMGAWSTLEYIAVATETASAGGHFYLSSVQPSLTANLPPELGALKSEHFVITTEEIEKVDGVQKDRVCLLDPQAEAVLSPEDGERFDWFVFGGILVGDDPPRDRTAELRKHGFEGRNLRKLQMTTDTAVRVTRMVIDGKQPIDQIPYTDFPELRVNKNESTQMPFRYVADKEGMPVMPNGMLGLIKKDADKSLDDLF